MPSVEKECTVFSRNAAPFEWKCLLKNVLLSTNFIMIYFAREKCKVWMCFSFLYLWLMQHFTTESETVLLVLLSRCFWSDSCQEVFEFKTQVLLFFVFRWHPCLDENCKIWRSLWRVLPTLLLLHPPKRTVMIQHCWTNIFCTTSRHDSIKHIIH